MSSFDGNSKNIAFAMVGNKKTQVECTGTCDDGVKDCRARYVMSIHSFECTCTGCIMTVTELSDNGQE